MPVVSVSYVVELMSCVTLNSSFSPASLVRLIGKICDVTIAEQRSMIQAGDMSTTQLTSPCVKSKQSHQVVLGLGLGLASQVRSASVIQVKM